ncbi:ubiquitin carboxyl-terminal hydrolase CYLD isoform X7 [Amblyomma americanum]
MNRTTQSHKPKVLLDRDIQNPRFDAGTLFEVLADDPYESKVKVQSLDPGDSGVILCNREILREVTSLEALVLLPVKPVRNRLKIYRDQEWLKEIPIISENKRVVVKDKFEGIVKFKGVVREYGPGIRFIVEIQDGTNDPIKRKQCFSIQDLRLLDGREIYHGHNSVVPRLPSKKKSLSSGITRCDPAPWHQERLRDFCDSESSPLRINDRVVWVSDHGPEYGTVRWLGHLHDTSEDLMVGVEFDNQVGTGTGKYRDRQLFEAQLGHASLIPLLGLLRADDYLGEQAPAVRASCWEQASEQVDYGNSCFYTSHLDRRPKVTSSSHFQDFAKDEQGPGGSPRPPPTSKAKAEATPCSTSSTEEDGSNSSPETNDLAPVMGQTLSQVSEMCRTNAGIQGHHNSCYLDATLFAMFSCTYVFDDILTRKRDPSEDIKEYDQIQKVLRDDIVCTLRRKKYVPHENVMKLRELLDSLGNVSGLTTEEKDPEEFLNSLIHALRVPPFLKLSSQQETHLYQLFVTKHELLERPTVQQLFHQSIHESRIKLKEIPKALIIQMPRCGKQFKLYDLIVPSLELDITDALENSPRFCYVCGKQATHECWDCFRPDVGLEVISYCRSCSDTVHKHHSRETHKTATFENDFGEGATPRKISMRLFAIVCIETSHYVCFVKCPVKDSTKPEWCFFDSMADREGGEDGHNIPKVEKYADAEVWLGPKGLEKLRGISENSIQMLPGKTRRVFRDAYMCMYENPLVMKYK